MCRQIRSAHSVNLKPVPGVQLFDKFGNDKYRLRKTLGMNISPEITVNGLVPVLSISPVAEDHCTLQELLRYLQNALDSSRTFTVKSCSTLAGALSALPKDQFGVVVCEQDLQPGSWKDVLEQALILPDPPSVVVTSRFADERLWVEALNLGAFDVLVKPFDRTESLRIVDGACRAFGSGRRLRETTN